jgi:cell division protein FtsI/penicillin-binding protein 2
VITGGPRRVADLDAGYSTGRRRHGYARERQALVGGGGTPKDVSARGWFVADSNSSRPRNTWIFLAFVAIAISVGFRLVQIQVGDHTKLAALAQAQDRSSITLHASRGKILDRDGHVLASDITVYDVYADPSLIPSNKKKSVAHALAPLLSQTEDSIRIKLMEPVQFVYLAKRVNEATKNKLTALDQPGVGVIPNQQRVYNQSPIPGQSFDANQLGFVDANGHGQYGVEAYYNDLLNGTDGKQSTIHDLQGNPIVLGHDSLTPAKNGQSLQLGLDPQVQYWAEQAIAKGVSDAEGSSGELLVMDVKTGSIRAWAQYPSYNANQYGSAEIANFKDAAIANLYEPGSVMKVVTYAGGLQNNAITPQQQFVESNKTINGYTIHDWDFKQHGNITFQTALDLSLNNGAIQVQQNEGAPAFYSNLLQFGIGAPTGVDMAGEVHHPLPAAAKWADLNYATASFGQGVDVTAIEMLAAINAVANGGVWVQPHAVDSMIDPVTGKATPFVPKTRRVVSPQTAGALGTMMTGVVEDKGAEGFEAKIPGFDHQVSGKTGTADEPTNGQYEGDLAVSFAGFVPTDHPQFTALVVIHSPQEHRVQRFGAFLAAPVFKQIAQIIIDQWRILP